MKSELSKLLSDECELRKVIKEAGYEQSSALVLRMRGLSEFTDKVLQGVDSWDKKVCEMSELAAKYYTELEEKRKLFVALRQLIKDKDTLIGKL